MNIKKITKSEHTYRVITVDEKYENYSRDSASFELHLGEQVDRQHVVVHNSGTKTLMTLQSLRVLLEDRELSEALKKLGETK